MIDNLGQSTKRNTEKVSALSPITSTPEGGSFQLQFRYMDQETQLIKHLRKVTFHV